MLITDYIGTDKPWLAPLAGFSDLAFRLLCRTYGCCFAFTEMISAKGLVYNSVGTKDLLRTTSADFPLAVQLFGEDPIFIARAMNLLDDYNFFDLNCGCSVKKVVKTGAGAALLQNPDLLIKIAKTMVDIAGNGKVGVKIRSGWDMQHQNFLEIAKSLEQVGVAWITLHPRYARQAFAGKPHYEHLTALKKAVQIPIIASGDLFTASDAMNCLSETKVDGVMFARGALSNPFVFKDLIDILDNRVIERNSLVNIREMILHYISFYREIYQLPFPPVKLRTMLPRFLKEFAGVRKIRQLILTCTSWEDIYNILDEIPQLGV